MSGTEIERLIQVLARLPGLGPRSARRSALHLIKKRTQLMEPLAAALTDVSANVRTCATCGNFDTLNPCAICADFRRDGSILCVVQDVADLWAMERSGAFRGQFHVLGGVLSALDGVGPDDLRIANLITRAASPAVTEVILALGATVDGQITAHYLADRLADAHVTVSGLAHGLPVGGELDYLDDGTIMAALKARRPV